MKRVAGAHGWRAKRRTTLPPGCSSSPSGWYPRAVWNASDGSFTGSTVSNLGLFDLAYGCSLFLY